MTWKSLPRDLVRYCLSYLSGVKALYEISWTCHEFQDIIFDPKTSSVFTKARAKFALEEDLEDGKPNRDTPFFVSMDKNILRIHISQKNVVLKEVTAETLNNCGLSPILEQMLSCFQEVAIDSVLLASKSLHAARFFQISCETVHTLLVYNSTRKGGSVWPESPPENFPFMTRLEHLNLTFDNYIFLTQFYDPSDLLENTPNLATVSLNIHDILALKSFGVPQTRVDSHLNHFVNRISFSSSNPLIGCIRRPPSDIRLHTNLSLSNVTVMSMSDLSLGMHVLTLPLHLKKLLLYFHGNCFFQLSHSEELEIVHVSIKLQHARGLLPLGFLMHNLWKLKYLKELRITVLDSETAQFIEQLSPLPMQYFWEDFPMLQLKFDSIDTKNRVCSTSWFKGFPSEKVQITL